MQLLRRMFALLILPMALAGASELVYVGTQARQIHAAHFDPASGKLTPAGIVAEGGAPTWTVAHPRLPILYAVMDDKEKEGSVTAYAVNRDNGTLAKINDAPSGGKGTTYLAFDAPSATLLAANFGSGSASSISVKPDGSLDALVSTIAATGSGPHRRQASAHAHGATVDPSGRYVLVPDLGADRVFVYGLDRARHALLPDEANPPRSFTAPPGSGPRRAVFAGSFIYVMNELTAELMALRWDAQTGRAAPLQSLPVSTGADTAKSGSELAASPDGRFLYVGNRGEHQIVVYRVHPATGELALVQRIASGGETPWSFALHPSGKWLLVANQRSGKVSVFSVDPASGMLADTGEMLAAPSPVSISFVR